MINTNEIDRINPCHIKYYARPNTLAECKEWTPAGMMKRYI
jgi:hypothetical protein